ncbi:MAG: SpoIIE family protein phosphatase [Microscillaceae bacterium]|nr:SpoIIE family protein phosphatase [Microscillaceae bacterium]
MCLLLNWGEAFRVGQDYWTRFRIESRLAYDRDWILFLGYVSEADVFIVYENGTYERKKTGFLVPNHEQDPNEGPEPKVRITLRAGQINEVYVRFQNVVYPPEITPVLQAMSAWQAQMNQTNLIQGFFQGLLALMFLYNLFLAISLRDRTYFAFVMYVLLIAVYFFNEYGYLEEYFLRDQPLVSFHLANLVYVAAVYYVQFNRRFLNIPQDYPGWDRLVVVWYMVSIVFAVLLPVLSVLDFESYMLARNAYHVFYALALILFIFAVLWMNSAVANLFVLGNFCILAGATFIIMGNVGIIPFSLYYLLFGIVSQLFVFTMALSYRFRRSIWEAQQAQDELIDQLQENQRLQAQINQELEEKVTERTREIAQKNEEIETQNEILQARSGELEKAYSKIQDSVRYAQRLQSAILGNEREIVSHFKDGFILFLPRDMVSGDFYWSSKIGHLRILIAADCTGHGIPGALMAVLGNSVLNDVVNEEHVTSPDEILYELDKKVVYTLQKQSVGPQPKDGMDIVVLTYDEISATLRYAGAKNPLYYVRDYQIHQVPASNFPIGIYTNPNPKHFELHEFQAREGDIFYLTTDGFQDQFGGMEAQTRKYLKKRFRELLLRHSHLPMAEQKKRLLEEFEFWKGKHPQTDDVLIVGIQI